MVKAAICHTQTEPIHFCCSTSQLLPVSGVFYFVVFWGIFFVCTCVSYKSIFLIFCSHRYIEYWDVLDF